MGRSVDLQKLRCLFQTPDIFNFGFLGRNGAGKTTTIRTLLGLYRADSGKTCILGNDSSSDESRREVGFMLDGDGLYDNMNCEANLSYYLRIYGKPADKKRVAKVLELVGLSDRAKDKPGSFSKGKATPQLLGYIVGMLAYSAMLIVTGINFCILFSVPLTREKVRGNIESAMAAAIHPKAIWFAKSAALFIPGVVTGYVFAFGLTQIIRMLFIPPAYGVRMSVWMILCVYLCVPLACFALSLLMNLAGMIGKVMDGGVIGIIFTAGMTTLMIRLAARKTVDAGSRPFLLVNFLLAVLLFAISGLFEKKLQPERIVLSCKE